MYQDTYDALSKAAAGKLSFLKNNPAGYFVSSMLAGIYVGFGILLIFTISGLLAGLPYAKIVMGVSFGVALSLVIIAGAELFTGNNLVMSAGAFSGAVSWGQTARLWGLCWLGNLAGSVLLALAFWGSGLLTGDTASAIAAAAEAKMGAGPLPLFLRGVLCNILVCLAVWCGFRCTSDSGKLLMTFWCLFAFITAGFEHSVANMTLLTAALLSPAGAAVSLGGWLYNLAVVTAGNMVGGIAFLSVPYFIIQKKKEA
ncbi:MAG: formate/nitrite transporter family protein [Oscillospiraceae bacterium]|nr:formate/nitrite transporter family protein [Oscillospiraceae bacterium]